MTLSSIQLRLLPKAERLEPSQVQAQEVLEAPGVGATITVEPAEQDSTEMVAAAAVVVEQALRAQETRATPESPLLAEQADPVTPETVEVEGISAVEPAVTQHKMVGAVEEEEIRREQAAVVVTTAVAAQVVVAALRRRAAGQAAKASLLSHTGLRQDIHDGYL